MTGAFYRVLGTLALTIGCAPRFEEHPLGTWKGRDNGGGDVILELKEDGTFTITQQANVADPRNYKMIGTFDYDYAERSREVGTYGNIDFLVEQIELESTAVDSLNLEPDDPESVMSIHVGQEMMGSWSRTSSTLVVDTSCWSPRPNVHDDGDCWYFPDGRLL